MAFEFQNPGPSSISHVLHRPFGHIPIGCGEYVPTAEQEAQGLTAEFFEDLVPSFLRGSLSQPLGLLRTELRHPTA